MYVGVGPEQNFSYIALTRASDAYILDLRRGNLLLQLLYKAAFERAHSRLQFLQLLFARAAPEPEAETDTVPLETLLAKLDIEPLTDTSFTTAHGLLLERLDAVGLPLDARDRSELAALHRRFAAHGSRLRFTLKHGGARAYPTLGELAIATTPGGRALGFLADPVAFRFVQSLQRANRIVPLVGNFAGDLALPGLARKLTDEGQIVGALYVSNVEQYLLATPSWKRWRRNVASLPTDPSSVFVRAYLDQGQRHPQQLPGHRTTTTLQPVAAFLARTRPYPSMLSLATDATVPMAHDPEP